MVHDSGDGHWQINELGGIKGLHKIEADLASPGKTSETLMAAAKRGDIPGFQRCLYPTGDFKQAAHDPAAASALMKEFVAGDFRLGSVTGIGPVALQHEMQYSGPRANDAGYVNFHLMEDGWRLDRFDTL